jgi:hypothetical protein
MWTQAAAGAWTSNAAALRGNKQLSRLTWWVLDTAILLHSCAQFADWWAHFRDGPGPPSDTTLEPLPFHALNIALHALASALVTVLAYRLFWQRLTLQQQDQLQRGKDGSPFELRELAAANKPLNNPSNAHTHSSSASKQQQQQQHTLHLGQQQLRQRRGRVQRSPGATNSTHIPSDRAVLTTAPSSWLVASGVDGTEMVMADDHDEEEEVHACTTLHRLVHVHLPAWATGVGFALHPVHTEVRVGPRTFVDPMGCVN